MFLCLLLLFFLPLLATTDRIQIFSRSAIIDAYEAAGDVDGLCAFIDTVHTAASSWASNVVDPSMYESVVRVLAPLGAWQQAEAFVQVTTPPIPPHTSSRLSWAYDEGCCDPIFRK